MRDDHSGPHTAYLVVPHGALTVLAWADTLPGLNMTLGLFQFSALVFSTVVATVEPSNPAGAAGVVGMVTSILGSGLLWYKVYVEGQNKDAKIEAINEKLAEQVKANAVLQALVEKMDRDFKVSRDNWHTERNTMFVELTSARADLADEKVHSAWLEGQLGIIQESQKSIGTEIRRNRKAIVAINARVEAGAGIPPMSPVLDDDPSTDHDIAIPPG